MKKKALALSLLLTCLIAFILPVKLFAYGFESGSSEDEIVYDSECSKLLLIGYYTDSDGVQQSMFDSNGKPICNDKCLESIIFKNGSRIKGQFCVYNEPTQAAQKLDIESTQSGEDAPLVWVRAGIYAVLGVASLLLVLYGLYGWYLRAMSEGQEDKVKESFKIYKNAIIGAIIVFLSFAATQIVFTVIGVTDSVFEFNFIPKIGTEVSVDEDDAGRFCYSTQHDSNGKYECVDNKWTAK